MTPPQASEAAVDNDAFERGYVKGYRAALGAAAAACRRQAEALDYSGNTYVRYGDATRCAAAVSQLSVPSIATADDPPCELVEADREYDAALTAHAELNRRIAEQGWIEVEFDALRKAGERFVAARIRRDRALAALQAPTP